ncbi:MAG TPA: hypothetical protein VNA22_07085 [Pyrinomonadaceae bacterium]|nr:hypothetical protein [Pyrinomonadaceae bacterium]
MLMEVNEKKGVQTKKEMILSLFESGITEIEVISAISGAKPSYVGSVLQQAGLIDNYFDLYTSTAYPMNVYSKYFIGKLGFKDVESAQRSVGVLENSYRYFDDQQDRAGQHHALEMALTMLDRARWTGKLAEAEVYRRWLMSKLSTPLVENERPVAIPSKKNQSSEEEESEIRWAA